MITEDIINDILKLAETDAPKAYVEVRRHYRTLRTVEECEDQLKQWRKQRKEAGDEIKAEDGDDALMRSVAQQVMLFDQSTLALLKLFGDAGEDIGASDAQMVRFATAKMVEGMVLLIRNNVNPTTQLQRVMQAARQAIFDEAGQRTETEFLSACLEAVQDVNNPGSLMKDMLKIM